jgi:hypothetical protein
VYAWFLTTYKVSVFVGMTGYFLLVLDMFGVGLLMARYIEPGEWPGGWGVCITAQQPSMLPANVHAGLHCFLCTDIGGLGWLDGHSRQGCCSLCPVCCGTAATSLQP